VLDNSTILNASVPTSNAKKLPTPFKLILIYYHKRNILHK
jgi:hypothetical protein